METTTEGIYGSWKRKQKTTEVYKYNGKQTGNYDLGFRD